MLVLQEFNVTERIKELCALRSWTYYRLAKESGIPYSTLNTMLRKTNAPTIPTLERICDGFGITLAQFFSVDSEVAKLLPDQRTCLSAWDSLDDSSKELALAYMHGLKDYRCLCQPLKKHNTSPATLRKALLAAKEGAS